MPASVVLTVVEGGLKGKSYRVEERAVLFVGKEEDCQVRFPRDDLHRVISRHHCLFDINPPQARVRDMGSRNGTYVNGKKVERIGGEGTTFEKDLKDGDEIRLGSTGRVTLRVEIQAPVRCVSCGAEVGGDSQAHATQGLAGVQCEACRQASRRTSAEDHRTIAPVSCARCGKSLEIDGKTARGETLCVECQVNPGAAAQRLLDLTHEGGKRCAFLDHYEIVREIGRGGMGKVYLARHRQTGVETALKVMLSHALADGKARQMFEREIAMTRALDHPNIVRLLDAGSAAEAFYFTMEYCGGGSVDKVMKARRSALRQEEALAITRQLLLALEYAHAVEVPGVMLADGTAAKAQGLVHRDLKPHNLFLMEQGGLWQVKVGDFGLAKSFDTAGLSGLTCTGALAGTPHYMPRQQMIDFRFAKPEVDVWSAAACLYYMLTYRTPRLFRPNKDVFMTVLETDPAPIGTYLPDLPRPLMKVIDHALRDRPEIGFKTARELRMALEGAV